MNNGVNENQNTLAPMEGVKIAPASDMPVNASNGNNTQVVNAKPQEQPVLIQPTQQIPQIVLPQEKKSDELRPMTTPQPVLTQPTPVVTPQPVIQTPPPIEQNTKKKRSLTPILLLVILVLAFLLIYTHNNNQKVIANIKYNCTPITSKEETKLDLNSTLVKDLYSKVQTNIREDIANPEFNDTMQLYLAYRQIKEIDKYDSNCNQFSNTKMEPFTCEETTKFMPKAFKEETLIQEIKKLYGEETNIPLKNIQLGSSCVVGYQYIEERKEFVEGYCKQNVATSYKVTKELKSATSTRNTIVLKEEVKYHENEKLKLPEYLKSGIYTYTFRLDMNYNYVLVDRTYKSKY